MCEICREEKCCTRKKRLKFYRATEEASQTQMGLLVVDKHIGDRMESNKSGLDVVITAAAMVRIIPHQHINSRRPTSSISISFRKPRFFLGQLFRRFFTEKTPRSHFPPELLRKVRPFIRFQMGFRQNCERESGQFDEVLRRYVDLRRTKQIGSGIG
ncbi:pentatricopeptide repeat-containing protein [Pyrus ussuriensis x Pyrus communis]|uniref:Pentatricopeptide repeat-containing protein n=1 Tax=Pyrus ussuriensis x Pyrus communis TaxID=2448454 RepID=A0A5N5FNK5_9ROSA|nr:pentatricopeptide repeat-containing protein [Pyrus ussuriensis x Pyrus communis]